MSPKLSGNKTNMKQQQVHPNITKLILKAIVE